MAPDGEVRKPARPARPEPSVGRAGNPHLGRSGIPRATSRPYLAGGTALGPFRTHCCCARFPSLGGTLAHGQCCERPPCVPQRRARGLGFRWRRSLPVTPFSISRPSLSMRAKSSFSAHSYRCSTGVRSLPLKPPPARSLAVHVLGSIHEFGILKGSPSRSRNAPAMSSRPSRCSRLDVPMCSASCSGSSRCT